MDIIERPPILHSEKELLQVAFTTLPAEVKEIVDKINEDYSYWDDVKYKYKDKVHNFPPQRLWAHAKLIRTYNYFPIWEGSNLCFNLTNKMQRMCHEFDMNFGGSWASPSIIPEENKEQYLISSRMEEAIFSSQIEGAATTRQVAKEMLRKKRKPKNKSQQMIVNNYDTICYIVEHKDEPLSVDMLLEIHRRMTRDTLYNPEDAGCFRQNDNVVVEDGITHKVVHVPPSFTTIPAFMSALMRFFNDETPKTFIHPVIRGIIIHYMLAYMHPFTDGNGRTARALFYLYMLKHNYWLTQFLSISRIIITTKKKYERAFLCSEADNNDIGYFINYNLDVLSKSYKKLQEYLKYKATEKRIANTFLRLGGINSRQAMIIKMFDENSAEVITVKDLEGKFHVTAATAKSDIVGLLHRGFLAEISFNKVKRGYVKGDKFDELIKQSL